MGGEEAACGGKTAPCNTCTSKSAEVKNADFCQPLFKNAICRYESRRQELDRCQRELSDKLDVMERSVPALMALNLLKNEARADSCQSLERVREMMKKLVPGDPDPAEDIVADLSARAQELNCEAAELNKKIADAEKELIENCKELKELECANGELEGQIREIQQQVAAQMPGIESITSDDRICLSKIRSLAEEEMRMKRNIRELEMREATLHGHIEQILKNCQENEERREKHHCPHECYYSDRHHVHKTKRNLKSHSSNSKSDYSDRKSNDNRSECPGCKESSSKSIGCDSKIQSQKCVDKKPSHQCKCPSINDHDITKRNVKRDVKRNSSSIPISIDSKYSKKNWNESNASTEVLGNIEDVTKVMENLCNKF